MGLAYSVAKEGASQTPTSSFCRLHRLPTPRAGQVLGLVGTNGIGKSTALKILAGNLKPNLGRHDVGGLPLTVSGSCLTFSALGQDPPDWAEILKYFRGSELQNYFTKVLEDNLDPVIKPQYVDQIPRAIKQTITVGEMLEKKSNMANLEQVIETLELKEVLTRQPKELSGGELQRFAIAMSCIQKKDV